MGLFDPVFGGNQAAISGLGMGLLSGAQSGAKKNIAQELLRGLQSGLSMQEAQEQAKRNAAKSERDEQLFGMKMAQANAQINQQASQQQRQEKSDTRAGEQRAAYQNYAQSFDPQSSLYQTPGLLAGQDQGQVDQFRMSQGLLGGVSPKVLQPTPKAAPTNVREYETAKTQGFKGTLLDFIQAKKGQGLSITMPDGTSIQQGGAIPALAPSKGVKTSTFKDILAGQQSLDSMDQIKTLYEPEFLTYGGMAEGKAATFLNKMNPDIRSNFQSRRSKFISATNQEFLRFRKWATGVAGGEKEMAEIKRSIFSEDDSPQDFESKLDLRRSLTRRLNARAKAALVAGIESDSAFKQYIKENPLSGVLTIQQRGDELAKQGYDKTKVLSILKQEGYM